MRDYVEWHSGYDDPASSLSGRLRRVQDHLWDELDSRPGPLRVVSVCAGDARDVIGVLSGQADAGSSTERPALGTMRFTGEPAALVPGQRLFTFVR